MKKAKRLFFRKSNSQTIVFSIAFIFLAIYALYVLFFFYFALVCALKPSHDAFIIDKLSAKLVEWTAPPNFKNFANAFEQFEVVLFGYTFFDITWNSMWRTITSSILSIMSSVMVCYILVFYRSKLTKFIYNLGIFVSLFPVYGSTGATYRLMDNLNFINNPVNMITSISLFGGYFFYMYAFMKSLSWEYAEAAFIDGAGHFKTFFHIMFPMALPSVSALFVMSFIAGWNDYESTLLYMNAYPNLSYGVYAFIEKQPSLNNLPGLFAGVLITLIPVLVLFLFFQNTIMEKVHLGGLKG